MLWGDLKLGNNHYFPFFRSHEQAHGVLFILQDRLIERSRTNRVTLAEAGEVSLVLAFRLDCLKMATSLMSDMG